MVQRRRTLQHKAGKPQNQPILSDLDLKVPPAWYDVICKATKGKREKKIWGKVTIRETERERESDDHNLDCSGNKEHSLTHSLTHQLINSSRWLIHSSHMHAPHIDKNLSSCVERSAEKVSGRCMSAWAGFGISKSRDIAKSSYDATTNASNTTF